MFYAAEQKLNGGNLIKGFNWSLLRNTNRENYPDGLHILGLG